MTMCKISYRNVTIGGSGSMVAFTEKSEYQTLRVPRLVQLCIYDLSSR